MLSVISQARAVRRKAEAGHFDLQCQPEKSSGYFIIAKGLDEGNICVCRGSHYITHYEEDKKIVLVGTPQMKSIVLQPFPVFVDNRYVQHALSEYLCHQNLRYHVYSVPNDINLPDALEFSYAVALRLRNSQNSFTNHMNLINLKTLKFL